MMTKQPGAGTVQVREPDRVRRHTASGVRRRLDDAANANVHLTAASGLARTVHRIAQLEREWDIERYLEALAASVSFTGLLLGLSGRKRWFALPTLVSLFLFQHAVIGWCPPMAVLRRLGVRTRREIEAERYALKAVRGDFATVPPAGAPAVRAGTAIAAVRA